MIFENGGRNGRPWGGGKVSKRMQLAKGEYY